MQRMLAIKLVMALMVISSSFFPSLAAAETAVTETNSNQIQVIGNVTDQTTTIKGITFPNVTIELKNSEGVLLNSTQANDQGEFELDMAKQPANTILTLTVNDGAQSTYVKVVTVAGTGWVENNGEWYYYEQNGEMKVGWMEEQGKWYFLKNNGAMATGWLFDNHKWYYMTKSGTMATGWVLDAGKWYYLNDSGVMQTGWLESANRWYYLNGSGAMVTGWLQNGGKWYYLNQSGVMATGWLQNGGKWYYLNQNGVMATGWLQNGGKWYYLNQNGVMATGWLQNGGKWYYLNQNGAMATGWLVDGGKWYYLNPNGSMKTGWMQTGTDWYLMGSSGSVSAVQLDAPLVAQMPELPRGCEVTSLAMLLLDAGIQANKMTLASQVRRDPTPFSRTSGGQVYFGNPYNGFVGDMYSFSKPGLGVYHGPIAELAEKYLPNRVVDFTGSNFEEIYKYLNSGKPVWVIHNVLFDTVPSQYWQMWNTPTGKISITYKEHSVLVTGYDSQYIYFNDPLSVTKNRKAAISAFKRGWEQMGKQAISLR